MYKEVTTIQEHPNSKVSNGKFLKKPCCIID